MEYKIIPTSVFQKDVKRLFKKYKSIFNDIAEFENELLNHPDIGEDLGGKLRKIRVQIKSKNKGKSGGARIITYNIIVTEYLKKIYLVAIYDKSEKETLTKEEINVLLKKCGLI